MQNIINKLKEDNVQSLLDFKEGLNSCSTIQDILGHWLFTDVMTKHMLQKTWLNKEELKSYILKRKEKQLLRRLKNKLDTINLLISEDKQAQELSINVEWKDSRTWGSNPQASLQVNYTDNTCDLFVSDVVSGSGYCKLSTALADVLNQCMPLIKTMAAIKNDNIDTKNHELLGYGSGYGLIPSFEGGVGESSLRGLLEKLGYKIVTTNHGKAYDFYHYNLVEGV